LLVSTSPSSTCGALTKASPSALRSALPRRALKLKEKSSRTQCWAGFTTITAGSRDGRQMDQVASTGMEGEAFSTQRLTETLGGMQ
jgi:hypothetical protein